MWEVLLWHSRLRIRHCHSCGIVRNCGWDLIPSPGTFICHGCGQKKKKKNTQKTMRLYTTPTSNKKKKTTKKKPKLLSFSNQVLARMWNLAHSHSWRECKWHHRMDNWQHLLELSEVHPVTHQICSQRNVRLCSSKERDHKAHGSIMCNSPPPPSGKQAAVHWQEGG